MSKIVINKPFVNEVMYKYLFKRFSIYISYSSLKSVFFISTKSVLDLFDKYWDKILTRFDGFNSPVIGYSISYLDLINELIKNNEITEEEYNILINQIIHFKNDNITFNSSIIYYEEINDYHYLYFKYPLKLNKRWDNSINNPNNEDIYLTYIDFADYKFNFSNGNQYYLPTLISYKLTDLQGDGDIKLDHIDKIDYIDSLIIPLKAPKEINLN